MVTRSGRRARAGIVLPSPARSLLAIVRACGGFAGATTRLSNGPSTAIFTTSPQPRRIPELEGDPNGALFFRIYVGPNPLTAVTRTGDAEMFSRLEYQSEQAFYLLERSVS